MYRVCLFGVIGMRLGCTFGGCYGYVKLYGYLCLLVCVDIEGCVLLVYLFLGAAAGVDSLGM